MSEGMPVTEMKVAIAPEKKRRSRLSLSQRRALYGLLYVSPWIIGFIVFLAYPLGHSLWLSFREVRSITGFVTEFVKFANFREAFTVDVKFVPNLVTTLRNTIVDTPMILIFSLAIALLANQKFIGRGLFRWIFFLPIVIGSGIVIQELNSQGVGNELSFLSTPGVTEAMSAALGPETTGGIVNLLERLSFVLWRSGVQILLFIAGLQGMPTSLYEAARVDGITEWELFWKITLPMLTPIILLNAIYTIVDGFTDVFNPMLGYIQQMAFTAIRMGYAAAMGWVYFIFIFVFVIAVYLLTKGHIFYAGDR